MTEKRELGKPGRLIWLSGLALALAVHAIGLLVFQVADEKSPVPEPVGSFASLPTLQGTDGRANLLREQAHFFDSAPLFLPTRWNAATAPRVRELGQRPPELFDSFPARLSYGDTDFGLGTIVKAEPETPLGSLRAFSDASHAVFGRGPVEPPVLGRRFALVEVTDPATGKAVLTVPITDEGAPKLENRMWNPVTFLVQVEAIGLVGQPVLMQGSGVEEVDLFLRASLRKILSGKIPATGYYQVTIGP